MNWRRGLIRLWIVASICWGIGFPIWFWLDQVKCKEYPHSRYIDCPLFHMSKADQDALMILAILGAILVPFVVLLGALVIIRASAWIGAGFKQRE